MHSDISRKHLALGLVLSPLITPSHLFSLWTHQEQRMAQCFPRSWCTEFPNSYASIMLSDADRKKSAFHRERLGIRWPWSTSNLILLANRSSFALITTSRKFTSWKSRCPWPRCSWHFAIRPFLSTISSWTQNASRLSFPNQRHKSLKNGGWRSPPWWTPTNSIPKPRRISDKWCA